MELRTYQQLANATDQVPGREGDALVVPLLGLAGEAASLLTAYKKRIRDGSAHSMFREEVAEELGDLLWYAADLATKFDLDLSVVAEDNLRKTDDRWNSLRQQVLWGATLYDEGYPEPEQFPREMTVEIVESSNDSAASTVSLFVDGSQVGNELQDNSRDDDGYRFHDVFHLGNVAMLGWSPTMRGLMHRKRRSNPEVDAVEDGGRAIVIDEGIAAYVFAYARRHNDLDGVARLDYDLLRTIGSLTKGLEVSSRSTAEWEDSILKSYAVWRQVRANRGGRFRVNLNQRSLVLLPD